MKLELKRNSEADRQFFLGCLLYKNGYLVNFEAKIDNCRVDILLRNENREPVAIIEIKKTSRKRTRELIFIENENDISKLRNQKQLTKYLILSKKLNCKLILARLPDLMYKYTFIEMLKDILKYLGEK